MSQIHPETGEFLPIFFQNTNPIVFVLFFSLYDLTSCIKEGIKGNIFGY